MFQELLGNVLRTCLATAESPSTTTTTTTTTTIGWLAGGWLAGCLAGWQRSGRILVEKPLKNIGIIRKLKVPRLKHRKNLYFGRRPCLKHRKSLCFLMFFGKNVQKDGTVAHLKNGVAQVRYCCTKSQNTLTSRGVFEGTIAQVRQIACN